MWERKWVGVDGGVGRHVEGGMRVGVWRGYEWVWGYGKACEREGVGIVMVGVGEGVCVYRQEGEWVGLWEGLWVGVGVWKGVWVGAVWKGVWVWVCMECGCGCVGVDRLGRHKSVA